MFMRVALFFIVVFCSGGRIVAQAEDVDARNLLKLNLSDWYFARYEIGLEHVLNASTSVQLAFAGIGESEDFSRYNYNNLTGRDAWTEVEINHSGWRVSPELRRYAWVYGGMPEGVFVSLLGRLEQWNLEVDEDIDDLDGVQVGQYQGELDGTFRQFHWGGGVMVGYQWYSDNGISIEVYTGPMFRSYSRSWNPDENLDSDAQESAKDSIEERIFNPSQRSLLLTSNSGPGWRFGLTVGLGL